MKTRNWFINLKKASKKFRRFEEYKKHLHILYSYLACDRKNKLKFIEEIIDFKLENLCIKYLNLQKYIGKNMKSI